MKTQTEKIESKTNENGEMNLQNIILVGQCNGTYTNASVTKEFKAKVLVTARPDGTVIVHNLCNGVRPLCYIDGGAEISLARNMADCELEFFATTEDGQQLTLQFTELIAMQGVPSGNQTNSLAMSVLKQLRPHNNRKGADWFSFKEDTDNQHLQAGNIRSGE
jgi:RecB family endonuclease NucS